MYPLKFKPYLKTVVWGGEGIPAFKEIVTDQEKIGESWEISGVKGHESVVADGPLAGKTITELMETYREKLVGKKNWQKTGTEFPLLIKFIDAAKDLSIQVHPNDELAARQFPGSRGKSEMWYIINAKKDASLLSGLAQKITPEEYEQRVKDNTITEVLCRHHVKEGDVFNLPAGRIHAICAGTFLAEIQETSDLTYRIYDYNRPGLDGKPRELHTELAKEAIDYNVYDDYRTDYDKVMNQLTPLVSCEHFTTKLLQLDKQIRLDLSAYDSFFVFIITQGSGTLITENDVTLPFHQGETILVPAVCSQIDIMPNDQVNLLSCTIV